MNSKMILLTGLLVTVFMSLIIYGFLVYSLYKDTRLMQFLCNKCVFSALFFFSVHISEKVPPLG